MEEYEQAGILNLCKVDVTDPVYHKNSEHRMNDVRMLNGYYKCFYSVYKKNIIIITQSGFYPAPEEWQLIGDINVHSGLSGFFLNKPDFTEKGWADFCNSVKREKETLKGTALSGIFFRNNAFFTLNNKGNHCVYGIKRFRKYIALKLE